MILDGIIWHYQGYELTRPYIGLSEKETDRLNACIYLVENEATLLDIEYHPRFYIPHSTLWYWAHHHLNEVSPQLYTKVCYRFKINLERRYKRNEGRNCKSKR